MALSEKIIELVIDKVLLGGIVLATGHWLNKRFEIFKNETNEKYGIEHKAGQLQYSSLQSK